MLWKKGSIPVKKIVGSSAVIPTPVLNVDKGKVAAVVAPKPSAEKKRYFDPLSKKKQALASKQQIPTPK